MAKKTTTQTMTTDSDVLEVTQHGYDELVAELEQRKTTLRDEISVKIKEARDMGDLSENHDFDQARQAQTINESRIAELEYLLSIAKVVDQVASTAVARIGHKIEIQKDGGDARTVILVGKEALQEADPSVGKVSIDSPIGSALLNQHAGSEIEVELPSGKVRYKILSIKAA